MTSEESACKFGVPIRFRAHRHRKFRDEPTDKLMGRISWINKQIAGLRAELEDINYELQQRAL